MKLTSIQTSNFLGARAVDVKTTTGGEALLYWLDALADGGEIDTALIFGTLKALPAQLLPSAEGFWIDGGKVGQLREVA